MRPESASEFLDEDASAPPRDDRLPAGVSTLEFLLLQALDLDTDAVVEAAAAELRQGGTGAAARLIAEGRLASGIWWPALAAPLGLSIADDLFPAAGHDLRGRTFAEVDRRIDQIWAEGPDGPVLAIAPAGDAIPRVAAFLASHPVLRSRMVVAPPDVIRRALRTMLAPAMTDEACHGLTRRFPLFSAARPPAPAWVVASALAMMGAPVVILWAAHEANAIFLAVFLAHALLRLMAALDPIRKPAPAPLRDADLPTYAVLIPLYREQAVVADLAQAMAALDYPRDRLEIRVLVEADDGPTLDAAVAHTRHAGWDVVVVPPSWPRTKPKALAFGLQLVDAEIVTVFDAEDRPDPDQLRKAAAALKAGGDRLACVQATLSIDHTRHRAPWIASQFALEYAMLFEGLVPWLSERTGWFLLGGTSNHFRREALMAVGGWDPYNVTEDADIALRLLRAGYRMEPLASVTREEAPVTVAIWLAQRGRWLKGWMQTWAVHMRRPVRLLRELGLVGFLQVQLLLAGQILAAFAFPASVIAVLLVLSGWRPLLEERPFWADMELTAALLTFALAWVASGWLAWKSRPAMGGFRRLWCIVTLPAYWLLLFPAVIRAGIGLARAPSAWAKTPHGLVQRPRDNRNLPLARRLWMRLSRRR